MKIQIKIKPITYYIVKGVYKICLRKVKAANFFFSFSTNLLRSLLRSVLKFTVQRKVLIIAGHL